MNSHRLPLNPASAAPALVDHPAEPFLRAAGLRYRRCTQNPDVLFVPLAFADGTISGAFHCHREEELIVFNLSLQHRPRRARAFRETARLCQFLNVHLAAGTFSMDELDGEVTFRGGHFHGSAGLQPDAFEAFFRHCLGAVQPALPAFIAVTKGSDSAIGALARVLPSSTS